MNEVSYQPDWFSRPGSTLLEMMQDQDLDTRLLAGRLGCDHTTVRDLLTGAKTIDASAAEALSVAVGGTPGFWHRRQQAYDRSLSKVAASIPNDRAKEWVGALPVADMVKHGWIARPSGREATLRSLLAYFGVNGPSDWERRYADFSSDLVFRTSPSFKSAVGPLATWLRQAEIEANDVRCAAWNRKALIERLPQMRELAVVKNPAVFMRGLRALCAEAGVALVALRAPTGCRASGAMRFLPDGRAMLVLSFRHLSDDHHWFTFFHEVAHLVLHADGGTFVDLEGSANEGREKEANDFAADLLVPPERRDEMLSLGSNANAIIRFAVQVGVSPGVVVGQMQRAGILRSNQMQGLRRRYKDTEIRAVIAAL